MKAKQEFSTPNALRSKSKFHQIALYSKPFSQHLKLPPEISVALWLIMQQGPVKLLNFHLKEIRIALDCLPLPS